MQACHWGVLERLFLLSLTVAAPAAVLVPILYWPYTHVSTQAYALQSSAVALLLLEVMLSRAPFVSYHWQVQSQLHLSKSSCMSSFASSARIQATGMSQNKQRYVAGVAAILLNLRGSDVDT